MGVQKKYKDADETNIGADILKNMSKDVLCEWMEEVLSKCDRFRDTSVSAQRTLNRTSNFVSESGDRAATKDAG